MNASAWGIHLLPFIEQQPLYDGYNKLVPPSDPVNAVVVATPIPVYICPSAPGGVRRSYLVGIPAGAVGGILPQQKLTFTAAPNDYTACTGVRGAFGNFAYNNNQGGVRHGVLRNHVTIGGVGQTSPVASGMADILDGTSNTFIIAERTGGDRLFSKRKHVVSGAAVAPLVEVNGGGWADPINGENWNAGCLYSGIADPLNAPPAEGPCGVNCTNVNGRGYHSFHPGGVLALLADASVQFVSENVAALAVAARITREKGEIAPPLD
jgi:hypothetical protein